MRQRMTDHVLLEVRGVLVVLVGLGVGVLLVEEEGLGGVGRDVGLVIEGARLRAGERRHRPDHLGDPLGLPGLGLPDRGDDERHVTGPLDGFPTVFRRRRPASRSTTSHSCSRRPGPSPGPPPRRSFACSTRIAWCPVRTPGRTLLTWPAGGRSMGSGGAAMGLHCPCRMPGSPGRNWMSSDQWVPGPGDVIVSRGRRDQRVRGRARAAWWSWVVEAVDHRYE